MGPPSLQPFQTFPVPVAGAALASGSSGCSWRCRCAQPPPGGSSGPRRARRVPEEAAPACGGPGPGLAPAHGAAAAAPQLPGPVWKATLLALTCSVRRGALCRLRFTLLHPAPGKGEQAWGSPWEQLPPAAARVPAQTAGLRLN